MLAQARELLEPENRRRLVYACSGVAAGVIVCRKLYQYHKRRQYAAGCAEIRSKRDRKLADLNDKLDNMKLDLARVGSITTLPMSELIAKLKSGELSAVDVLHSYQKAALDAHDKTNCLTDVFDEAEEWARALDAGGSRDGILHGVPISIKDNISTKGHLNSRGCLWLGDVPCQDDCLLIKIIKSQGAVPFVKTNLPQLVMGVETSNAIYGRTCNPRDTSRTPGGSSGGEGAIIAAGGSILGLGTDIGGSVRIPASHCGICSLKTTSHRLSFRGAIRHGQTVIRTCFGPMARDVDSLTLFMKACLTPEMFDQDKTVPLVPFDDALYQSKEPLTIGYYTDDGIAPASPPMTRAVLDAKRMLEVRGHTLVPWTPPDISFVCESVPRVYSGDKGCLFLSILGNEIADISVARLVRIFLMPTWIRYVFARMAEWLGERGLARVITGFRGVSSVLGWFNLTSNARQYADKFEDDWRKHNLDAVICPSMNFPAPKLGYSTKMPYVHTLYPALYNFVDYAAGIVPVGYITQTDIDQLDEFAKKAPKRTNDFIARDMKDSVGLPVTVQCVAPMYREEVCLRLLKELEDGRKQE